MAAIVTPEAEAVLDSALKLSATEREKLAWLIVQSVHPELRPEMFHSAAEVNEYLAAKPDAIVGA